MNDEVIDTNQAKNTCKQDCEAEYFESALATTFSSMLDSILLFEHPAAVMEMIANKLDRRFDSDHHSACARCCRLFQQLQKTWSGEAMKLAEVWSEDCEAATCGNEQAFAARVEKRSQQGAECSRSETDAESIKANGEAYRFAQAAKVLRLFAEANGRPPSTIDEAAQFLERERSSGRLKTGKIEPDFVDYHWEESIANNLAK